MPAEASGRLLLHWAGHPKPRGKVPRCIQWDYEAGGWKPAPAEPASSPSDSHRHRARDAANAQELMGLHVDIPMAAFHDGSGGGATTTVPSMVVKYDESIFMARARSMAETRQAARLQLNYERNFNSIPGAVRARATLAPAHAARLALNACRPPCVRARGSRRTTGSRRRATTPSTRSSSSSRVGLEGHRLRRYAVSLAVLAALARRPRSPPSLTVLSPRRHRRVCVCPPHQTRRRVLALSHSLGVIVCRGCGLSN